MAFDENLAARIRQALGRKKGIEEKKMFGGVGLLLNGNVLVGVWKDSLIVRLGDEQAKTHCWSRTSGHSTLPARR